MSLEEFMQSRGIRLTAQNVAKLESKVCRMKLKQDTIEQRLLQRTSAMSTCFDGDWSTFAVCVNDEGVTPKQGMLSEFCGFTRVTCCVEDEHFSLTIIMEATYDVDEADGLLMFSNEKRSVSAYRNAPLPHCTDNLVAGIVAYISVEYPEFATYMTDQYDLIKELDRVLRAQKRPRSE